MIVKVCGMREEENIRQVEQIGIDWMGFIFYVKSKRHVAELPAYLPVKAKRVGVFVDYSVTDILEKVKLFRFNGIQLHGAETPAFCQELRSALKEASLADVFINKAFGIAVEADFENVKAFEGVCDHYIFDTKTPTKGGAGYSFDWSLLKAYQGSTPFLLSGGIGPDSLEALRSFAHPQWVGIDLNSKFEIAPALKDAELLNSFIKKFSNNE